MLFMFPVFNMTEVGTWLNLLLQTGVLVAETMILKYLIFDGGWLDMLRLLSYLFDGLVIKFTDKIYSYFDKLLNGTIFAPDVVDQVMNSVYIFVSVLVLFKLMMLLMKYLINPDMVSDQKMGASALVVRVVTGMSLMLFLPTIFSVATELQSAILSDNLFGKLLLDRSQLKEFEKNKDQMGRVLSFNVYQAFWNLNSSNSKYKKEYQNAIDTYDPYAFTDINAKDGKEYAMDYFPIISCVALGYVAYLILKYCLDVVVRMFKLFVLQMLGPLAITDYMINGDSKEMFKAWLKTTISAYVMLFIRIFSIWFVGFVTILMQKECNATTGECNSLLYIPEGQDPDYLLRALITLGLLAFLMDLPKMLSSVFGLDLEQDASVKGLLGKVGGVGKMLGVGALAAGGAAIGGAIGGLKNSAGALKNMAGNMKQNKANLGKSIAKQDPAFAKKMSDIQNNKDLTSRQKSRQMNQATNEWMKNDKQQTKAARKETRAENQAALSAWKDAGGNKSGVAKPNKQQLPQRSAAVREYQENNRKAIGQASTSVASGGTHMLGSTIKSAAGSIPGLREATNSFSQAAGVSAVQSNLNHPVSSGGVKPVENSTPDFSIDEQQLVDFAPEPLNQEQQLVDFAPEPLNQEQQLVDFNPEPQKQAFVDTVANVPVSSPNSQTGERTTKSGIILPSNVKVDKK